MHAIEAVILQEAFNDIDDAAFDDELDNAIDILIGDDELPE